MIFIYSLTHFMVSIVQIQWKPSLIHSNRVDQFLKHGDDTFLIQNALFYFVDCAKPTGNQFHYSHTIAQKA